MSDDGNNVARTANGSPAEARPDRRESESQWTLVWREFRRRRLAVVCGCVIAVLITASVFAPFLANDRPIYYQGYNRFEYREALRTLRAVVLNMAQTRSADRVDSGAIDNPLEVIGRQIEIMRAAVAPETAAELRDLEDEIGRLTAAAATDAQAAAKLREAAVDIRRRFDDETVQFVSGAHFPVLITLTWLDVAFMVLNALLLTLPAWRFGVRRAIPAERAAARKAAYGTTLIVLPLVCAAVWWLLVPERIDRTPYKAGVFNSADKDVQSAPVVYNTVTWPAVPYGLDEDNLDARYLKPAFWSDEAELASRRREPTGAHQEADATSSPSPWDQPHWLGTDGIGRDVLSRMIWGGRVSLSVGIVAVSIYATIGIIVGSIAGYFRGLADLLISRLIEIVICFPAFFLILTIVAFLGPSIFNIMIVIGAIGWTRVARLVRGEFLRLGEQEFVLAARALGYSPWRIIFRHVLPNAMAPVLVAATFGIAGAILTESALSFLGFGITVPKPSWGGILATGRDAIFRAPWLIYFPGFAIFLTITAYNLVGEAFRDAADPRLRGQHVR